MAAERAILTPPNERLQKQNSAIASDIPGNIRSYVNADINSNAEEGELLYPTELLNSLPEAASLPDR